MDLNRNQFFMIGLMLLMLGAQMRAVDAFVLNEKATKFLAKRLPEQQVSTMDRAGMYFAAQGPSPLRRVEPPKWIGYSLLSVGAVLVLHALSMKKPGAP
ncbi:MAG TPA: hypothetical protein VL096_11560 [Pirellulaceae bacterium]|nr:hypothetical protein [Pirellulaceae bacterium]